MHALLWINNNFFCEQVSTDFVQFFMFHAFMMTNL